MRSLPRFSYALVLYGCFFDPSFTFVHSSSPGLEFSATLLTNHLSSSSLLASLPTLPVPLPTTSRPLTHLSTSYASIPSSLNTGTNVSECATVTPSLITSTPPLPTQSVDPATLEEIELMQARRLSNIIGRLTGASNIQSWYTWQDPLNTDT